MSHSIQTILAVNTARLVHAGCRLLGHQGTSLTGRAAMMLSPSVTGDLASQVRRKIIVVCGTNGKTTTNNLLCTALETEGYSVVCNRLGANMPQGIAAAFSDAASLTGRLDADYACLEVDEASAVHLFTSLRPDYMILTNLFRDQLDRYGEIDHTMDLLEEAIREVPGMKLIINADDPLCAYLALKSGNPYTAFGISGNKADKEIGYTGEKSLQSAAENTEKNAGQSAGKNTEEGSLNSVPSKRVDRPSVSAEIREGRFCKCCGAPLAYDFFHFGQMGIYHCTSCGFRRPDPAYTASGVHLEGGLSFDLSGYREPIPESSMEEAAKGETEGDTNRDAARASNRNSNRNSSRDADRNSNRDANKKTGSFSDGNLNRNTVESPDRTPVHFETGFRGLYNLYNILAVWSVLQEDRKEALSGEKTSRQKVQPGKESFRQKMQPGKEPSRQKMQSGKESSRQKMQPGKESSRQKMQPGKESSRQKMQSGKESSRQKMQPGKESSRQKMQPGKEPPHQKLHRKEAVKKRGKEISVERKIHTDSCFRQALHNYHTQFGRNELFFYKEWQILLNLAKNPTGFNQNIDVLLQDRAPKDLIIVINDNDQDGVDVSWLWDVDFDRLADDSVRSIYVSGTRALDMQLRLKYVGIDAAVMETPEEAIRAFLREDGNADRKCTGNLYILVNYTALMPVHLFLQKICTGTEQNRKKKFRSFDRDKRLLPRVAKFIRRDG